MTVRTACARLAIALLAAIGAASAAPPIQVPAGDAPIRFVPAELQDSTWLRTFAGADP